MGTDYGRDGKSRTVTNLSVRLEITTVMFAEPAQAAESAS
jgi:hypothetical protein